jgi:cytosine/adenosine deaminase-related metal-dependent hydrolase
MTTYRADWLLPIVHPPIPDAWVEVDRGRIVEIGSGSRASAVDLGRSVILPSLVNAHTHLELSHLHGRVPGGDKFDQWIRALMALRRQRQDPDDPEILSAARRAIDQVRASGTGLVGDVGNSLVTVPLLRAAGMAAQVFYELIGFKDADPAERVAAARAQAAAMDDGDDVRIALAPHAPYSVSPPLFGAIRADIDRQRRPVSSVHLGESAEEVEFVRQGTGAIRAALEDFGVWTDWTGVLPSRLSPVGYLAQIGFLDRSVLVVHGVQFDWPDLSTLASLGVTIASCPRSNRHVGVGSPPLEAFYAMNVEVAFGTDSLASVADLNMFAEVAEARRIAPKVPPGRLLESATLSGARALGFEGDFGSIEPGKRASLIAVRFPERVADVEEYLVSGIDAATVTWLPAATEAP